MIPYVLSLAVVIAVLVMWVFFAVQSGSRLGDFAERLGVSSPRSPWIILGVGCALLVLLIVFVTHQLARSLAEHKYARKQEEFVSGITHEMKSPLAAVKLHAETLLQGGSAEEREQSVNYILRESERLGKLIDNLLESSRLVSKKRPVELSRVEVDPFLHRFFEDIRPRVEQAGMELDVQVSTDCEVMASEEALDRVLSNLVDNAVRYSDRGGQIRFAAERTGPKVELRVEDDGFGIPKSELARVFDRFHSIGKGAGSDHGTGLGLFIVSKLVDHMGGSVFATSHEGRAGTTFVVQLPVAGPTA